MRLSNGQWPVVSGQRPTAIGQRPFFVGPAQKSEAEPHGQCVPRQSLGTRRRSGLTLFEVIIALAIFLIAVEAVSELLTLSTNNAVRASMQTQGAFLCQSKMAEVLAGIQDVNSPVSDYTPFDDPNGTGANAKWQWKMDCQQNSSINGLWTVQISVKMDREGSDSFEYSLTQLMYTPSQRGSTLDSASSSSTPSSGGS